MFSTPIQIAKSKLQIEYTDKIISMGSCFAENIGNKLQKSFFDVAINPFGVLYNPLSITQNLEILLDEKLFLEDDLFQYQSLWRSFSHSTHFTSISPNETLDNINKSIKKGADYLKNGKVLLLTFGTAWIFEHKETSEIVANCHKLPAKNFNRRRLSVEEIVKSLQNIISKIRTINPTLEIVFSVSPIRHWKDGAHENSVSKSTLHLAVNRLVEEIQATHYFPAYELMMDELRDYRFYAVDMLHPSESAIDYIWLRFSETYFSTTTFSIKKEMEQFYADLNHLPLHPDTNEFQQFQLSVTKKRENLLQKYPFLMERI